MDYQKVSYDYGCYIEEIYYHWQNGVDQEEELVIYILDEYILHITTKCEERLYSYYGFSFNEFEFQKTISIGDQYVALPPIDRFILGEPPWDWPSNDFGKMITSVSNGSY